MEIQTFSKQSSKHQISLIHIKFSYFDTISFYFNMARTGEFCCSPKQNNHEHT